MKYLKSANTLYFKVEEVTSLGGVGILLNKKHILNISNIRSISPKVIMLILKVNKPYNMKVL